MSTTIFRPDSKATILKASAFASAVISLSYVADRSGFSRTSQLGRLQASTGLPMIMLGGAFIGISLGYVWARDRLARRLEVGNSHLTMYFPRGIVRLPYDAIDRVTVQPLAVCVHLKEPRDWRPYFEGTPKALSLLQRLMVPLQAKYDCDLWMFPADIDGQGQAFVEAVSARLPAKGEAVALSG